MSDKKCANCDGDHDVRTCPELVFPAVIKSDRNIILSACPVDDPNHCKFLNDGQHGCGDCPIAAAVNAEWVEWINQFKIKNYDKHGIFIYGSDDKIIIITLDKLQERKRSVEL